MRSHRYLLPLAVCVLLAQTSSGSGDDDDDDAKASGAPTLPQLSAAQRQAVGIRVAHPLAARMPERIDALGLVLDPTVLLSDAGEASAAAAAERSTSSELTRLNGLYSGGAGASMKLIEAAQAEAAKAQAQARSAAARLALHWGPVAALPPARRQKILDAASAGASLLLRADIPGRHSLGIVPRDAVLDVDGIQVPARVLGLLRQTTELQSVGLLLEVDDAPAGFGPGARVPLKLLTTARAGLLLPRDALLFDENGTYVYKELTGKADDDQRRYAPVRVQLLAADGEGWLVDGIDGDDNIVVQGAGVLWSLQEMGAHAVDADEDAD